MQALKNSTSLSSAWHLLKNREITCEEAIKLLVNERGIVNLDLLAKEVSSRFFWQIRNRRGLPPVIPLLLWRNCYYLGCPVALKEEDIKKISDRTNTEIKIIPIAPKSYKAWFLTQNLDLKRIDANTVVNPLTGESEPENISEVTELYLSKAADQIERVKTLVAGALRNRAIADLRWRDDPVASIFAGN